MKAVLIFALGLASTAASLAVHAETYQWKDSAGRTVISDTPPPGNAKVMNTIGGREPEAAPAASEKEAPKAPTTMAEKELAFQKRQQEARDKAAKEAKERAAAEEKRKNCESARRNLAAMRSDQAVATYDANGQRTLMDDKQRAQEIERAQGFISENCR